MARDLYCSSAATFAGVRTLAERMLAWCAEVGISADAQIELELAIVEAGNNVVRHGHRESGAGEIDLEARLVSGGVQLVLIDRGKPIPMERLHEMREPPTDSESGRGINIIVACVEQLAYARGDGSNRLTLFKALPSRKRCMPARGGSRVSRRRGG